VTKLFDVVETRRVLEIGGGKENGIARKSGLQVGRAVFQKEGVRGL